MADTNQPHKHNPHVLIVGAGIGGLTMAQCLRKHGIAFTVIERDTSDDARAQGWCIALHSIVEEMLASMPDDMPPIEQVNHLRPLDDQFTAQICMYAGDQKFYVQSTSDQRIIRANRRKLREWLGTGVDVQWGVTVDEIEEGGFGEDGRGVKVKLSDGRELVGDVLVGADGVNSRVRKYLFPDRHSSLLQTLPIGAIIGEPRIRGEHLQNQLKLGHSAYAAIRPGFHLFAGLKEISEDGLSGTYYWFVNWHDEAARQEPYWTHGATKEQLREYALEKTSSFDSRFSQIVKLTPPEDIRMPPIVFKDMELDSLPKGRVTLLGDAAHPMVPFRGEGGLHAIKDAMKLSTAIQSSTSEDLSDLLFQYQEEMLKRGTEAVKKSRDAFQADQSGPQMVWGKELQATTM